MISGLPWSGTSGVNQNSSVPLEAVVFLKRGKDNHIVRLDSKTAVFKVLNEIPKPFFPGMLPVLLERTQQLVQRIPFYLLQCNMNTDAAETVKEAIF